MSPSVDSVSEILKKHKRVEGLVHVTELGQDYFHFDAARHQMMGERSGHLE